MSINEEYYVMVYDFSNKKRLDYVMGEYASVYSHKFQYDVITQPVEYNIDDEFWQKGRSPEDVILDSDGLIIKNNLKEDFFEGYWLLSTPDKPKEWLDLEKTEFKYRSSDNTVRGIESYHLNESVLKEIPLEARQLFSWDDKDYGYTHQIIHKSWVDYLKKFDNRNVKFIPLLKFKSKMANQGPLPDFAI